MSRILRLVVAVPLLLLLVLFLLSNRGDVAVTFWPTDYVWEVPLSLVILGAMGVAFLMGGLIVWISALRQRRRARRAEHAVRLLEAQVQELKSRIPSPAMSSPAG
jgi:uncharacterized integral membrane protein